MTSTTRAIAALALAVVALVAVMSIRESAIARESVQATADAGQDFCTTDCSCSYMHPQEGDNDIQIAVAAKNLKSCEERQEDKKKYMEAFKKENPHLFADLKKTGNDAHSYKIKPAPEKPLDDDTDSKVDAGAPAPATPQTVTRMSKPEKNCMLLKAFANGVLNDDSDSDSDQYLTQEDMNVLGPILLELAQCQKAGESGGSCVVELHAIVTKFEGDPSLTAGGIGAQMLEAFKESMEKDGVLVQGKLKNKNANCKHYVTEGGGKAKDALECFNTVRKNRGGQHVTINPEAVGWSGGDIFSAVHVRANDIKNELARMHGNKFARNMNTPHTAGEKAFTKKIMKGLMQWHGDVAAH